MKVSEYFRLGRAASLLGDFDEAVVQYRKGTSEGDLKCIMALSGRLMDKRGNDYNPAESIRLVKIAVEKNHAEALCVMGDWYSKGFGYIEKDMVKAMDYYSRASEQDYPEALRNLALIYLQGSEDFRNVKVGLDLLRKASYMGYPPAFYTFALAIWDEFHNAKSKKQEPPTVYCNKVESIAWMIFAREAGDERAEKKLKKLNSGISQIFFRRIWKQANRRTDELMNIVVPYEHP